MARAVTNVDLTREDMVSDGDVLGTLDLTVTGNIDVASSDQCGMRMDVKATVDADANGAMHLPCTQEGTLRTSSLSLVGLVTTAQHYHTTPCISRQNEASLLPYLQAHRTLDHDGHTTCLSPGQEAKVELEHGKPVDAEDVAKDGHGKVVKLFGCLKKTHLIQDDMLGLGKPGVEGIDDLRDLFVAHGLITGQR